MSNLMISPPMIQRTTARFIDADGTKLDKPTGFQVFMAGLKKFGGMFAKIGGSILSFMPGFGQVAGKLLYNLGDFAHRSHANDVSKRQQSLAMDQAIAQSQFNMVAPGYGSFSSSGGMDTVPVNPEQLPQRLDTVQNRELAASSAVSMM